MPGGAWHAPGAIAAMAGSGMAAGINAASRYQHGGRSNIARRRHLLPRLMQRIIMALAALASKIISVISSGSVVFQTPRLDIGKPYGGWRGASSLMARS